MPSRCRAGPPPSSLIQCWVRQGDPLGSLIFALQLTLKASMCVSMHVVAGLAVAPLNHSFGVP